MKKTLSESRLLHISDELLELPPIIQGHLGQLFQLVVNKKKIVRKEGIVQLKPRIKALTNLRTNWAVRKLYANTPFDAIIIDQPKLFSEGLHHFASKHAIPVIVDGVATNFYPNTVTRHFFDGFILPSQLLHESQNMLQPDSNAAVIPVDITKAHYWKSAGYKSQLLNIVVIALNPHQQQLNTLIKALDVVASLNPDLSIDIISTNDQNSVPLLKRIHKAHIVITVANDPVWIETAALTVASGIPLISPKRPIHRYISPKHFPGYIIADWQIDTLSTIIQNSIYHPEETYRVAKNAQHWLKTNIGSTFLPLSWVSALNQLLQ